MSFSFRDKGRLSDRLRGKTCDEILKELRDHLHHDRGMSFEPSPSWGGFSSSPAFARAGFPFMDQDMMSSPDMRAHFEDLASRHPEFAEHLRPTGWTTVPESEPHFFHPAASGPNLYRQRHSSGGSGSGSYGEGEAVPIPVIHEDSGGGETTSSRSRTRKIPQYGMRNTVDLGESQKSNLPDGSEAESRSQRSWSAPPDNRTQVEAPQPKRFVTRVDVNNSPANQTTGNENEATPAPSASNISSPGKPPPFPKASGAGPAPQSASKQGNVRHIPIFVEGRDEPILPKSHDGQSFASSHSSSGFGQPNASYSYASASPGSHSTAFASSHSPSGSTRSQSSAPHPQASGPFPHASGPFPHASGPFPHAGGPFPHASGPFPHASGPFPHAAGPYPQASTPHPQTSAPHTQASAPQKPKQETPPPQQPPKQALPKDPIARVQAIQEEVNALKNKVESFSGSRSDKEYIYLDEMLTRNLLKLDDIETEGKDNIRQARKEAIRSIERCIGILESRAPLPQETNGGGAEQSQAKDVVMDEKSTDVCEEEMSQSETVASDGAIQVPLEPMEVHHKLDSQEPTKSETLMEIAQDATENDTSTVSGPDSKPGESAQSPQMMEVISENGSQDVAASDLKLPETEVQISGGEGGEQISIDTTSTEGANADSGHCDENTDTADSNSKKNDEANSAVTEIKAKVNGATTVTTEQENAASGEPMALDERVVRKSDSSEPVNSQNAQNESVNVSKDSESAVTNEITDKPNVNDIPPVEAVKKDVSS